ncbi:MAG: hypothetical protein WAU01_02590 [Saprospiraceae bacterium]
MGMLVSVKKGKSVKFDTLDGFAKFNRFGCIPFLHTLIANFFLAPLRPACCEAGRDGVI